MPNITMQYGDYSFSPVPPITLNKEYTRTNDGTIIGSVFKLNLDGVLYAPTGGLSSIIAAQDSLRDAFDIDGKNFTILCDGSTLIDCYPRINGPNFAPTPNNWVLTCQYSIELEFDDEPAPTGGFAVIGENTGIMPPFLRDAQESWSVEFIEDKSYYMLTLPTGAGADSIPYQLRLTHNVSAVGKKRYTGAGLEKEAWESAKDYVLPKLGYNSSIITQSGVLNLQASAFGPFNHMRSCSIDESAGSYGVVETWMVINSGAAGVAGRAIEDFTVEVRTGLDNDLTTVGIQGLIQGLETRTYGTSPNDFAITESKFVAASGYWNTIKDTARVYPRAQLLATGATRPLNIRPLSKSVGYNPSNGTINYSYEYNDRPSNCVSNAINETITITDTNPVDVFAEIQIPGRALGPILQDMGTITTRKRDINIDVMVAPATGCGTTSALFATNPSSDVNTIINLFYAELTGSYGQVFKHQDTSTWEPKTGRYTVSVGWTYQDCS